MQKLGIVLFIILLFCLPSFASDISNQKIIDNIERSLFFDDKSNATSIREDDSSYDDEYEPKFDIITTNIKTDHNLKEKERLAYNANLIGQYEVAIELYKNILKENPKNEENRFALAFSYQKLKQYREAKFIYYQLLKSKDIDNKKVVSNLVAILIDESPGDAIYLITKLLAQYPDSTDILVSSAILYDQIDRTEDAINFLKKALIITPKNLQYQYNLAIILDKNKQYKDAAQLYENILNKLSLKKSEDLGISLDSVSKRLKFIKNYI